MPKTEDFRYTEENPYIGKGLGRNVKKDKVYTGVSADVAEFEDMYFNQAWNGGVNKSGLGIDEYCDACIQFARKNYADLMPDGSTKKVGNTIKSRKMSGYLERFIDDGVNMLLHGDGSKFISSYYDYIERIYNYQIPIKEIASKGKIKKTLKEYVADCSTVTKSGSKKSRQAWYELVLKNNINAQVSDTIYYINTGTKKGHSDVKRVTHQYVKDSDGNEVELLGKIKSDLLKKSIEAGYFREDGTQILTLKELKTSDKKKILEKHIIREEDEIILNCQLVPNEIIENDEDILCSDVEGLEYNSEKYIDQFNSRIRPLLVCFSPEIRNSILITSPEQKQYFTDEQTKLVSGYPNKETDQDTYEALMTPERKEIDFWLSINERPPFVDECGLNWDELVKEHLRIKKEEEDLLFQEENNKYLNALNELTKEEVDDFYEEGTIPEKIAEIVTINSKNMRVYFKKIPSMTPSTGGNIFDDIEYTDYLDNNPDE